VRLLFLPGLLIKYVFEVATFVFIFPLKTYTVPLFFFFSKRGLWPAILFVVTRGGLIVIPDGLLFLIFLICRSSSLLASIAESWLL